MSDPALGLLMLALIVVVIMMGFPTAFTLMGLGIFFGYIAFYDPTHSWANNRVFDLMVERTYGAMTNDVLISIPLFVLMGYLMERGALVDKMFYSIQLAFRRVPASLAVATLIVCTFWGIASGLVGVSFGVLARPVMGAAPAIVMSKTIRSSSWVSTPGTTCGASASRISAARRPAARIPAKPSAPCNFIAPLRGLAAILSSAIT